MNKFLCCVAVFLLCSCGSSKKEILYIPADMPEICQNIDFHIDKSMRSTCGVKPARSQGYRNVPLQRYLITPPQASLVKTGDNIEIRFPGTFPVILSSSQLSGVIFSDTKRLSKIQNEMEYKELYSEKKDRFKVFKLLIPHDNNPEQKNEICFKVPELKGSDRTRSAAMGVTMELLSCSEFQKIVDMYSK